LTPYKVLATSGTHGFVQFVESTPVAEVLDKDVDGSIQVTGRVLEETNNIFCFFFDFCFFVFFVFIY